MAFDKIIEFDFSSRVRYFSTSKGIRDGTIWSTTNKPSMGHFTMQLNAQCNLTIHPNFVGYHKCGYANCPVCKTAVTNSGYWHHIKSHPGHENDSPPQQRLNSNPNTRRENKYGPEHRSFDKNKTY